MKTKSIVQMKNQVRADHKESKWLQAQYIPTMEEYMTVALVTSAYSMLATTSLLGIGDLVIGSSWSLRLLGLQQQFAGSWMIWFPTR